MRFDDDRIPPVFMTHGERDYGGWMTQTEMDLEWDELPPSRRMLEKALVRSVSSRAAGETAHGLDQPCRPTSDRRPGSALLDSRGPNLPKETA